MKQTNATLPAPIRVLLVDDHDHVLWGLAKLIDGEWPRMMVAGTARSASEAARLLGQCRLDVVVVDLYLATDDGRQPVKSFLRDAHAGILVLNRAGVPTAAMLTDESGADGVVAKDAPAELLLQEIERLHRARSVASAHASSKV